MSNNKLLKYEKLEKIGEGMCIVTPISHFIFMVYMYHFFSFDSKFS